MIKMAKLCLGVLAQATFVCAFATKEQSSKIIITESGMDDEHVSRPQILPNSLRGSGVRYADQSSGTWSVKEGLMAIATGLFAPSDVDTDEFTQVLAASFLGAVGVSPNTFLEEKEKLGPKGTQVARWILAVLSIIVFLLAGTTVALYFLVIPPTIPKGFVDRTPELNALKEMLEDYMGKYKTLYTRKEEKDAAIAAEIARQKAEEEERERQAAEAARIAEEEARKAEEERRIAEEETNRAAAEAAAQAEAEALAQAQAAAEAEAAAQLEAEKAAAAEAAEIAAAEGAAAKAALESLPEGNEYGANDEDGDGLISVMPEGPEVAVAVQGFGDSFMT
ncbi:unnamed protein product [Amoebophrya sp. A25]|nr:unnamed protein product [Amoebophrya sp. A25]|eukprot:GSA25T00012054001.1